MAATLYGNHAMATFVFPRRLVEIGFTNDYMVDFHGHIRIMARSDIDSLW